MAYNWGLIGTSAIAKTMAAALRAVNGRIYGVASGRRENAEAFAKACGVSRAFTGADELLADPAVDIVYIATPHSLHYDLLCKAVEHGKHVLCEKSITVNDRQLEDVLARTREKGVVVLEAMTLYHMPLYKKLRGLIASGAIGKIKMVQISFGIHRPFDPQNRLFNKNLAGGALLDIGVYALAFARYFLETQPNAILSTPFYAPNGVDNTSGILLKNDRGQMAVAALTFQVRQPRRGVVAGEKGYIEIDNFPRAEKAFITYTADGHTEVVALGETSKALEYEVLDMQDVVSGAAVDQSMDWTRDVTSLLTAVRSQWGMVYPFE